MQPSRPQSPLPRTSRSRLLATGLVALALGVALAVPASALQGTPGQERQRPQVWAITGATVIPTPGTTLESATVVIRDGLIEAVGADVEAPADATVIDGSGMTVWAGWIDAYTEIGLRQQPQEEPQAGGRGRGGGDEPDPGTGHPIEGVHPEYSVTEDLIGDEQAFARHRSAGFTSALVVPRSGIYKGHAALVALRDGRPNEIVVEPMLAQNISLVSRRGFGGGYPSSLMGVIATVRQVFLDAQRFAQWQESYERDPTGMRRPAKNDAFPPLLPLLAGDRPVIFDTPNARSVERAIRLTEEFGLRPIVKGSGEEYRAVGLLADAAIPVIVPVDYPDEPDVGDEHAAMSVDTEDLMAWEMAPGNAAALAEAGIRFAFTTDGLDSPGRFTDNVRRAIEAGLSEDDALAALTTRAAEILGVDAVLGSIEPGKIANVVVGTGAPFADDTEVAHVFVDGRHHEPEEQPAGGGRASDGPVDPRGTWEVTAGTADFAQEMTWVIEGSGGSYSGTVNGPQGATQFDRVTLEGNALTVSMTTQMGAMEMTVYIRGDTFNGSMQIQDFSLEVSGRRTSGPGALATLGGSR